MRKFYQDLKTDFGSELKRIVGGELHHEQYESSDLYVFDENRNKVSIQGLESEVHKFLVRNKFFLDSDCRDRLFNKGAKFFRRYFHMEDVLNCYSFSMEAPPFGERVKVEVDVLSKREK